MEEISHPFAELIGLVFSEQGKGWSVCAVEAAEKLNNPYHTIHGAVLYSLADTGMGGALASLLDAQESCSTIEIKITYYHPVRTGKIVCRSRVIHRGRRVAALESEIVAGEKLVAKASGSFYIFPTRTNRK